MTDKAKNFFEQNFKWLITVIFFAGVNVTAVTMAVESKIDRETAIHIVDQRLDERAYPLLEGRLSEKDIIQLKTDIADIKKDLKKALNERGN